MRWTSRCVPSSTCRTYKGLKVKRPVAELTDKHVDEQLTRFLEGHGQIVPKLEGAAELGDYLTADLSFCRPDGQPLNEVKEIQFRLQPEIRFQDGAIADSSALLGAKPGDTREVEAKLGTAVVDPSLRGATTTVRSQVIDLKRLRLPELNQAFLDTINVDSEESLREAVRDDPRAPAPDRAAAGDAPPDSSITCSIKPRSNFPSELVSREEKSTISRLVAQLKREGMSDDDIRAHEAQIRANAHETTLRTLERTAAAFQDRRRRGDQGRG